MPTFQVSLPDGTHATHDLTEDTVTVGRISDNTVQIEDISVSSYHAQLALRAGDYVLVDLGSTNGTRYNGNDIVPGEEQQLQDGDRVRFGNVEVTYTSENTAEQRPMPADEEPAAVTASASVPPADFANASPFQTKKKKKDPAGTAIFAFAGLAILVFFAAVASVFSIKPPM